MLNPPTLLRGYSYSTKEVGIIPYTYPVDLVLYTYSNIHPYEY